MVVRDFSAFVFDMDGLVLDTESAYFDAWQRALTEMGYVADLAYFRSFSGQRFAQIRENLLIKFGDGFEVEKFKMLGGQFWREHVQAHGITLKPGVIELVDFAENNSIPHCIATNSPAKNAFECLELAGIRHLFPIVISSDEVKKPKPAPDIFLKAAETLNVEIDACVVFEDSPAGVMAAYESGAYPVYVPSVLPADPVAAALCACKADNLLQVWQSLTSG